MFRYICGGYTDNALSINKNASGGAVGVNVMSDKEIQVY